MNRTELALKKLHEGTVIPANPLALDENRKFDEKRQRALCRYYLDSGVGGLAVAVHTTQFEIRKPEHNLLEAVLSIAKEEADAFEKKTGEVIVMVAGACGPKEQAVKEAELAKKLALSDKAAYEEKLKTAKGEADRVIKSAVDIASQRESEIIEDAKQKADVISACFYSFPPKYYYIINYST